MHSHTISYFSYNISHTDVFVCFFFCHQVLPLENKMKNPDDFGLVLYVGMFMVCALYVCMGLVGYLCFGDNLKDTITLNLPETG